MRIYLILLIALGNLGLSSLFAQKKTNILDHKDRIRVKEVSILNSRYRETNLSITPDGKYLFFMSLRGEQRWSTSFMTFKGDSVFDGDIWYSTKMNGQWQRPQVLPYGINTFSGEDEPHISTDGNRVYYQSWYNSRGLDTGGPYYVAQRKGKDWSTPRGLGGGIAEFFSFVPATDGMTMSPDERRFIVAAGMEYDKPMDIYMSKRTSQGWGYMKRLPISTDGDERSVFLASDGKTLYFASDGYGGLGGLDIFKTTLNSDGSIGEVINIGKPFNSPGDDYGFILTGDGKEAYFIRNGNIQFADLREADERIRPNVSIVKHSLKGSVKDSSSWVGLKAKIQLYNARTKQFVQQVETSGSGKYTITLPNKARVYDQVVMVEGYPPKRRRITVKELGYAKTYPNNFLLGKPGQEPQQPIAEARPPVIKKDPPKPKPTPKTPQKTQPPPKTTKKPQTRAEESPKLSGMGDLKKEKEVISNKKVEAPKAEKVEIPEDPYSFEGVAENNLILLLDVSASMKRPDKLPLLKNAFTRMLGHMRAEDRISIIVYSGEARVVLEAISAAKKNTIEETIDRLRSSGATKGKGALKKAYRLAEQYYIPGGNNRIIMATDGYFDVPALYSIPEKSGNTNIFLSVFSFGKLKQSKLDELEILAEKGQGNFASINRGNVDEALLNEAKAVKK
ncbi:MAG: VWA domain-containing protein [Bacteroidota bacterium]